jgi:type IV pilus assembly protein PilA
MKNGKTGPGFKNGKHWTQTPAGRRKLSQMAALRSRSGVPQLANGHRTEEPTEKELDGLFFNALWQRLTPAEKKLTLRSLVERGFSLIELLVVVAIILIIAAIAIPNLLRAKMSANQASAVGSLRTLNTACIAFSTSYGSFPAALTNLGPVGSGTASSTSADLIDGVLSSGTKSGYTFAYAAGGSAPYYSYTITATPNIVGKSGQLMYFTDSSGVIRADVSGSGATASSTPIGQ